MFKPIYSCAGWSESSLGANVLRYLFLHYGSLCNDRAHITISGFKDETRLTIDVCADYRSFGSPLLTATGTSGLKVIAMTIESVPECFSDLPTKLQERFPPEFRFQLATKLSSVYNVVSTESRHLADDLFLVDERL